MAIIRNPILPYKRRCGRVVFYPSPAGLIVRYLNPHTRKRILKDPRFAAFRKCSKLMAKASKIGSAVYKALPADFRQFWMYRAFVGEAMKMLKDQAMTGEQTLESLFRTYVEVWYIKAEIKEAEKKAKEQSASTKRNKTVQINIRRKEYDHALTLAHIKVNRMPVNILRSDHYRRSRNVDADPPVKSCMESPG
ncbi:hypothetical protein LZZ85_00250 [Terrimonas sp. NA20]|uniref:Uncharacterized protein n=1 Tax=Terrimonas ginsenosidimutans TaxID=2908004 RepID=A0ABS9KK32_9BACT|nr:hypothetical protein [Terrimonas ginsenosidimutans]MCG2612680.1 hypothetical protein [Terrimonas ginsenosidimutans]